MQPSLLIRPTVSPSNVRVKVEAIATVVQPRLSAGQSWPGRGQ